MRTVRVVLLNPTRDGTAMELDYEDERDDLPTNSFQNRWVRAYANRPKGALTPTVSYLASFGIHETCVDGTPEATYYWDAPAGQWRTSRNPKVDQLAKPILEEVMERLRRQSTFGAHLNAEQRESTIECIVAFMALLMDED